VVEEGVRWVMWSLDSYFFPETSWWVDSNLSQADKEQYWEYRYNVLYHYSYAEDAERNVNSLLGRFEFGDNGIAARIYLQDPSEALPFGDMAIREAASTIDAGLILTNHILNLGVDQRKLRWFGDDPETSVREALKDLPDDQGLPLVRVVDQIFNSIGYKLLKDYRNWVTHRGAPRIDVPNGLESVYLLPSAELPDELQQAPRLLDLELSRINSANDAQERRFLLEGFLEGVILRSIKITCWPFVPPFGEATEEVSATIGRFEDNATEFLRQNRLFREDRRVQVAGETLAVYSAQEYSMAIGVVVTNFVRRMLRTDWDQRLSELCRLRRGG
jgi:hypothetical protein